MDWVKSALSEEQLEVLNCSTRNSSIIAAAGSGKTRTLVYLLARDLASGVAPTDIVAFTFTEKAANELLARIHHLVRRELPQVRPEGMFVGTIHAWCFQHLLTRSDFYDFSPIDELQLDSLASRLYDYLELERNYACTYPRGIGKLLADLEVFYNENLQVDAIPERARASVIKLLDVLFQNRLLTFGGMIRHTIESLRESGPVENLKRLYVDEYQDINPAQVALIQSMMASDCRLTVVGDELQCIYNWRGSDVRRILEFGGDFGGSFTFYLTDNYRARPQIVAFANEFAKTIDLRDPKKEMTARRTDDTCKAVHWLALSDEQEQADTVADIVQEFAARGVPWNRMAILLRSVTKWGRPIVDTLIERNIPVQCPILTRGGEVINGFLVPLFQWLSREHPEPKNEFAEQELEDKAEALWNALRRWMPAETTEHTFWNAINQWLDLVDGQKSDAYDIRGRLYDFLDKCAVRLAPDEPDAMMGFGIASQIIRSVEEVHRRRLFGQERRTPRGVNAEVYYALLRKQEEFGESVPLNTDADCVTVTTVHQAKGLEWPVVLIPMLTRGCFPVRQRTHEGTFPGEISKRYGTSTEDERRLFYVAVTRAKERLFLLDTARFSERTRSIFLTEQHRAGNIHPASTASLPPFIWDISRESLQETDRPPVRIGLAELLLYLECPYQYGLRRMVGIQPSVGQELGYGLGLHGVIRRRFDDRFAWQADTIRERVDRHVNLPYMSQQDELTARRAIATNLSKLESLRAFEGEVESEMQVEVVLHDGVIHGVIDIIHTNEDGTVVIRDWKASIHDRLLPRYERQLQFYVCALHREGKEVSKAEIVDISQSARDNTISSHQVDVSEHAVRSLLEALEDALEGIAANDFSPKPNAMSCSCCDMYRLCAVRTKYDAS